MQGKNRVRWAGGLSFVGSSADGHSVVLDGDRTLGMSPMEMLLVATGACACIDLVMILEKARQQVLDAWVEVAGERRDELPRYYTSVTLHFVVTGIGVREQHVRRAIDLAMEKYCSASAQLKPLAELETSFEIIEHTGTLAPGADQ